MKKYLPFLIPVIFAYFLQPLNNNQNVLSYSTSIEESIDDNTEVYELWLKLYRKRNVEILYHGIPGDIKKSKKIREFKVKSGIPDQRPTPLPQLLGKEYWLITSSSEIRENEEIGPYFLKLNVPYTDDPPYGPVPYQECDEQCNWELPGAFGLHGVSGDRSKLSIEDPGSSGCVRHSDSDIAFLYHLLDLSEKPVRYYIEDL